MTRNKVALAVYLVLRDGSKVLLLRRQGSGWQDGSYSLIAGHVDAGESATTALMREAIEEAGVSIDPSRTHLVHVMHRRDEVDYVDLYFEAHGWDGEPSLMEPSKADDLRWFEIGDIPPNTVPSVRQALESIERRLSYSEDGWPRATGM